MGGLSGKVKGTVFDKNYWICYFMNHPGKNMECSNVQIKKRRFLMSQIELIATATFGLEAVVSREVEALGYTDVKVQNAR
ncbi:MAG TPA: hypothetical protein DDW65_04145, partial [Firmicutes bacterium]|nr:hypothetical protein [Bacillota bacterium]